MLGQYLSHLDFWQHLCPQLTSNKQMSYWLLIWISSGEIAIITMTPQRLREKNYMPAHKALNYKT